MNSHQQIIQDSPRIPFKHENQLLISSFVSHFSLLGSIIIMKNGHTKLNCDARSRYDGLLFLNTAMALRTDK